MLRKLCVLSSLFLAFVPSAFTQDSRRFTFCYAFAMKNLAPAKRVGVWIPVDIAEDKHQEKRDYLFGSHDVNRVQFSTGRDLRPNPPQDGKRLDYFVYPYVEVAGQECPKVSTGFSFADRITAVAAKEIGGH